MTEGTLVRANLGRKMVRTVLLVISIFIAFLIFGFLVGATQSMLGTAGSGAANRLVVTHRINFTFSLPYAHFNRIKQVEGVVDATHQNWFGGYYQEPQNLVQTFAVDPESYARIFADEYDLPPGQWEAFIADRTGIVIPRQVAEQYGLRLGQRIPLYSNIYTNTTTGRPVWDFTIRGISPGNAFYGAVFHQEYFRETSQFGGDASGIITAVTRSPEENQAVADRIDALFANSPFETSTQDEQAFNRSFLSQYGDIRTLITLVVGAAFVAILLVVGNTMVMAVRERTKEIGVLKTLGFSSGRVMRMVLSESMLVSLIGAVLGLGFAALVMAAASPALETSIGPIAMPWYVALAGLAIAIVFGLVTGIVPALQAFNLRIVDAFARK